MRCRRENGDHVRAREEEPPPTHTHTHTPLTGSRATKIKYRLSNNSWLSGEVLATGRPGSAPAIELFKAF